MAISAHPERVIPALATINDMYTLRKNSRVTAFLEANPSLVDVLLDAKETVSKIFEGNPSLVLEPFTDPDDPEQDQLFLLIQTRLPLEEAMERLDKLDETWWLDAVTNVDRTLVIDIESI